MVVRSAAWAKIMFKVNAVGVDKRTIPELKKKWSDLKKKVKAKMAAIYRSSRQTGGGPSSLEKLSELEEKVGATCRREQIEGFGHADVCMQAQSNRENIISEPTELNTVEIPTETSEMPNSEGDEPTLENQPSTDNPSRQSMEMQFPDDLGLSQQQTEFLNDYTSRHLQFMRQVDARFDRVEKGFENLATAYLSGANTISQSLTRIANLLEIQSGGAHANRVSPSPYFQQSGEYSHPLEAQPERHMSPNSIAREQTFVSENIWQASGPESVDTAESVLMEDDSAGVQALDLSVCTPSKSTSFISHTALDVARDPPSSAAHFLLACKHELSSSEAGENRAETQSNRPMPRRRLGNTHKGHSVMK